MFNLPRRLREATYILTCLKRLRQTIDMNENLKASKGWSKGLGGVETTQSAQEIPKKFEVRLFLICHFLGKVKNHNKGSLGTFA